MCASSLFISAMNTSHLFDMLPSSLQPLPISHPNPLNPLLFPQSNHKAQSSKSLSNRTGVRKSKNICLVLLSLLTGRKKSTQDCGTLVYVSLEFINSDFCLLHSYPNLLCVPSADIKQKCEKQFRVSQRKTVCLEFFQVYALGKHVKIHQFLSYSLNQQLSMKGTTQSSLLFTL